MSQNHLSVLKMLVTIVDRGKGAAAVSLYREQRLHFDYLCMGLGTANSKILDYFGLSETEKDVVITLGPRPPRAAGHGIGQSALRFQQSRPRDPVHGPPVGRERHGAPGAVQGGRDAAGNGM